MPERGSNSHLRALASWLVVATALALAAQATRAEPDLAAPLAVVRATLAEAEAVVATDAPRARKLEALRGLSRDLVDTRALGRRSIGPVLRDQSEADQAEFLELFDLLIVRSYLQKMLFFENPHFRFGEPQREGRVVVVHTSILSGRDEYFVEYEMTRRGERWVARDVIVEGLSIARNYHHQFKSMLRDRSFAEILELMRRKTRRLREDAA
jgi:phospholipid transport system substrate-binding protein